VVGDCWHPGSRGIVDELRLSIYRKLLFLCSLKQDIDGTSPPIDLPRGHEREHAVPAPEPAIHSAFENGSAISRAQSLAMNDADAVVPLRHAVLDEIGKTRPGFVDRHAVQVDLGLYAEATALQLAHRAFADMLAMKPERAAMTVLDRIDVVFEALNKYLAFVGFGKPGFGLRFRFCGGHARLAFERPGAAHRLAKLVVVFVFHSRYSEPVSNANQGAARPSKNEDPRKQ